MAKPDYPAQLTRQRREADDEILLWLLMWGDGSRPWSEVSGHLSDMLRDGHGDAHGLGVRHAGARASDAEMDRAAQSAWEQNPDADGKTQAERWDGLHADVEAGMYGTPGEAANPARPQTLRTRVSGYTAAWAATANEAWTHTEGEETLYNWRLGHPKTGHCESCPAWARGGPYTRGGLPAVPGDGTSECRQGCHCEIVTTDGKRGFRVE